MKVRSFVCAVSMALVLSASAAAQVRPVTLDQAISMGLEHSPDMKMGAADVDKAAAEKASALGQMGPRLGIDAGIQYWDKATDISFTLPPEIPFKIPATRVMERTTSTVALQAVQPVSPLYSMYNIWALQKANERAAVQTLAATRSTVRFRVAEAFFRLLMATRMSEVAQKAVEMVDAHLKTARSFHESGIVGRDDVLRAEAALAKTQEGLNQALAGVALARAALNVIIGLRPEEPTMPAGDYPDPPPEVRLTLEQCLERAMESRPEVGAMNSRLEMASAGRRAAMGAMVPVIAAVFRWGHQEGSKFQRENSWLVGGTLTWNFWEWGATYYKVKSASADESKAREGMAALRDGVALDVTKAFLDLRTAHASIATNRKTIEAAEENLRVVTKKYEAATATSVEVLDANTTLIQARVGHQVALFTYHSAMANLERATGGGF